MITPPTPDPKAELAKLERICAQSELCSFDVLTRLRKRGITGNTALKILNSLVDNSFVNDERFATAFAYTKARAAWGPLKIKASLAQKRITGEVARQAIEQVEYEVFEEGLIRAIQTKAAAMRLTQPPTFDESQKILRFAAGRGFEVSTALALLKKPEKWLLKD